MQENIPREWIQNGISV